MNRTASWVMAKFSQWLAHEPSLPPIFLYDFDKIRFEIRTADVLLVEGRSRISDVIKQITQSTWSHAALYIGRLHDIDDAKTRDHLQRHYQGNPNEQLLIESIMGQGTVLTPLSHYKDRHIRICRPRGISREDTQNIVNYATEHLGARYSFRHVFDLARFLFPWGILPRRWRSSLFVHNALKPTEEICSSLIASAFQSVHFPILPEIIRNASGLTLVSRNPRLYTPKDFDCSPFFDIIKYPFLSILSEEIYKRLPWLEDEATGNEYIQLKEIKPSTNDTDTQPSQSLIKLIPDILIDKKENASNNQHNDKTDAD